MIKTKKHKQTSHVTQNNDFREKCQKNCISFWSVAREEKRTEQKVLTAEENVPLQWDRGWDCRDALGKPGRRRVSQT